MRANPKPPAHAAGSLRSQEPLTFGEPAPTACRHPVSGTVSLPSSGCFSPFPHGTCALSVTEEYLGLEGGPPTFRQDCTCPALLMDPIPAVPYRAVTVSGAPFQALPVAKDEAAGLVRVRSPLLAESRLMSFPPATEMFQFTGFASRPYGFRSGYPCGWVAPFGDPGIKERSPLPPAFRSVPRPSSPLSAKASTRCPSHALDRYSALSRACARVLTRPHAPSREDTLPPRQSNQPPQQHCRRHRSGPPRSRTHFLFTLSNNASRSPLREQNVAGQANK